MPQCAQTIIQLLSDDRLEPVFAPASRGAVESAWHGHVPFAHWIIDACRPRVLVELGVHNGVSYAGFCDAILASGLSTRAFAVDTWIGDAQAGFFGSEVYEDFRKFHDPRYRAFSTVLRCTFDGALDHIADGSVDLLHIDGEHTYDAARHDFESWSPKLSDRAVVLFHDINVHRPGYEVWRLWSELRERHPGFAFLHSSGLGVLAVGRDVAPAVTALCALAEAQASKIRGRFALLGAGFESEAKSARLQALIDMTNAAHARQDPLPAQHGTMVADALERLDQRISVVIPLYNGAAFIEQALHSVLNQTVPPHEIIVVDDGSRDNGAEIVRLVAAAHPLQLLSQPNAGQSAARNLGIRHSTGTLIALLDQDDIWYPTHLEELVKPFLEPRWPALGWVYSNLDEIDRSGNLVSRAIIDATPSPNPKADLAACLKADMFVVPTATLISRKAFDQVGGFDEGLSGYEDDDLFLRLFRAGFANVYLATPLAQWRLYSASSSYSPRMARSRMTFLRKLIDQFPDDARRELFYARNFLAPRFFPWMVREYTLALADGTDAEFHTALTDLRFVTGLHKLRVRLVMAMVLPVLRFRRIARPLLPAIVSMRPVMRRLLR